MVSELAAFLKKHAALLMLKLDGLTVKLVYEDGKLVEGSTRGDSNEGELITHNVSAFRNVPLSIPYKERLVRTGEGFIHKSGFERLKDILTGSDGMVLRFDSFSYSASLGRTGHHYNDGIAFKFKDDTYEMVFRREEWQTGRSGEIAPVAV